MVEGDHPLQERMVLFWHGYFTSSFKDVKSSQALIEQNELLRRHALGSFRDLLRGIVHDAAMLEYLDNNQNRKASPNENFARELMELFTLGEGHYTEQDVKEAARALTGWTRRPPGPDGMVQAEFRPGQHDRGMKTLLGVTGKLDADDVVKILLDQPACSRWVAGKLLAHFEGRAASDARLERYAELLRDSDWQIAPVLRALFLDPEFYSDEVRGTRIAGPIDYLVGNCRRLGMEPPGQLLWLAAGQIGQRLFDPPNVKGWEGGPAWITTSTLLTRGNLSGMLLGVVDWEDVVAEEALFEDDIAMMGGDAMQGEGAVRPEAVPEAAPEAGPEARRERAGRPQARKLGEMGRFMRYLRDGYRPNLNLSARCARAGARTDTEIVACLASELLAVQLTEESRAGLVTFLEAERERAGAADGKLLESGAPAEKLLRKLAHVILSLPEAQLH
jgi:hypothetical protein